MLGFLKRKRRTLLVLAVVTLLLSPALWIAAKLIKLPHESHWLPAYTRDLVSGRYGHADETQHLFLLLCDHWEPGYGAHNAQHAEAWLRRYKEIVQRHRDDDGRMFQYTWFYPIDNRDPATIALLADACFEGYGEVEVHWHHAHQSSTVFEADLVAALEFFADAGATVSREGGPHRWAFIHGNWALDNSRLPRQCGIDDELTIFQRHGCYADLTFPALGTTAQPRTINRIYYAVDTPEPGSHATGELAAVGTEHDGLMMIPGPLALNFSNLLVLMENAALDDSEGTGLVGALRRPSDFADYFKASRVHLWNQVGVGVEGRREWVFVKVHAHGMQHEEVVLGGALDAMLEAVEAYCADHSITLHYITAREAFNLVKAAERGLDGDPTAYYDLQIPPPLNTTRPIR